MFLLAPVTVVTQLHRRAVVFLPLTAKNVAHAHLTHHRL